jgi:aminoglycoside phosphotransferase (APT) family kinase protein
LNDFEQKLSAVLDRAIPGFHSLELAERLSGGASQETYRLQIKTAQGDCTLAMRRAPGGAKVELITPHPGLEVEARLMRCAREAGVPEPEVLYILTEADGLGDGFIMQWLDGITLGARVLRSPELDTIRPQLAYLCGQALARIHAIDLSAQGLDKKLEVIHPGDYLEQTWERYRSFDTPQPMIDYTARWLRDNLPPHSELALVHNDFRNGNIMFSPQGIVAVLDWEMAHIGDPMRDLGWICTNPWRFGRSELPVGGFGSYEDFFAGYENISGAKVDRERVRYWEVFGSFWWAVVCLAMAEQYRRDSDPSVERPAIGRRSSESQVDCVNLLIPGEFELLEDTSDTDTELPGTGELLESVRNFLHKEVMEASSGRTNFLARVAGNSLDIVLRDQALGPRARFREHARLQGLLGDGSLDELRGRLVQGLRDGNIPLDLTGLAEHLRATVANQVAIDQPGYSGLTTALKFAGKTT